MKPILEEIEKLASRLGTHPVWGYNHCLRVCMLAENLAREEGIDYDADSLRLASLLHDIGLYKVYSMREGRTTSAGLWR